MQQYNFIIYLSQIKNEFNKRSFIFKLEIFAKFLPAPDW